MCAKQFSFLEKTPYLACSDCYLADKTTTMYQNIEGVWVCLNLVITCPFAGFIFFVVVCCFFSKSFFFRKKSEILSVCQTVWIQIRPAILSLFLFCCFTSQVNSYGRCGTVSSPNHTFSWAGLNKRITSNSCTYFRL